MANSSFVPRGQEGLLLRDPLSFGFSAPAGAKDYKPLYSKQHDYSHMLNGYDRDALHNGGIPKKIGFYTRNNPHPVRACHIKGLNDAPVCCIEDNTEPRYLMSPPTGEDLRQLYYPPGSTRFSARGDIPPAVGVVPVTYAWRDELEKKTSSAINRALGQPPPSRGGTALRRNGASQCFEHMDDGKLLDLLCQILQTESIPACQAWLKAASESEKTIVLNMIRMAANGEFITDSARNRPRTSDSNVRYVWAPERSLQAAGGRSQKPYDSYSDNENFNFSFEQDKVDDNKPGLYDAEENPPFKLPENDTVIKTARQLSNLASRQGSRCGSASAMLRSLTKEPPSPSRNAQLIMVDNLSKSTSDQLQSYLQRHSHEKHTRSASHSGPIATHPISKRPRSRSATTGSAAGIQYPPAPVKLTVMKERLRDGRSRLGAATKLQYTAHWGSQ